MRRLHIAVGTHPHLQPLRDGRVTSPLVEFVFHDHPTISRAFRPMVEDQAFDVSEIALGAFLQAHAARKPLALLPLVEVGGFHHRYLRHLSGAGPVTLADLPGSTLGVRSYSQTTGLWVRAILAEQFGIDLNALRWLTLEGSHSAGFTDPPHVQRAPEGETLASLLETGAITAAVVGPEATGTVPVVADASEAENAWYARHQVVAINHMLCLTQDLAADADITGEIYRMVTESHRIALGPQEERVLRPGIPGPVREGTAAVRDAFDLGVRYAHQQELIPDAPALDDVLPACLRTRSRADG